jgi:hypothetical protein
MKALADTLKTLIALDREAYGITGELTQQLVIPADSSLTDQGRIILSAVASGNLAPAQGASLVGAIGSLARVIELDEMERRLSAIESSQKGGTTNVTH